MATTQAVSDWSALVRQELPQGVTVRKVGWKALKVAIAISAVSMLLALGLVLVVVCMVCTVFGTTARNAPVALCSGRNQGRYGMTYGVVAVKVTGFSMVGKALQGVYEFTVK